MFLWFIRTSCTPWEGKSVPYVRSDWSVGSRVPLVLSTKGFGWSRSPPRLSVKRRSGRTLGPPYNVSLTLENRIFYAIEILGWSSLPPPLPISSQHENFSSVIISWTSRDIENSVESFPSTVVVVLKVHQGFPSQNRFFVGVTYEKPRVLK